MTICCGTCQFASYDMYPCGYYCENKASEMSDKPVVYDDLCKAWKKRSDNSEDGA